MRRELLEEIGVAGLSNTVMGTGYRVPATAAQSSGTNLQTFYRDPVGPLFNSAYFPGLWSYPKRGHTSVPGKLEKPRSPVHTSCKC